MADRFWRGATNSTWDLTANWWTTIGGTTTGTPPGAADIAFFNANGTTTARNVYLNAPSGRALGIFWMNGNAQGDITLLGGTSAVPATQTLTLGGIDMSGTLANAIFSSSVNVALANAQSWSIGSGRTILVSGVISGAFKLTSNNSGVIILGNANTYSGGTDISAGTVRAGNNQALGTGAGSTITMTGGTLSSDSTSARTLANALTLNGTMTLGDATNTGALTFSGTTTIAGTTALTTASVVTLSGQLTGSGTLTKSGAANLFLTGTTNNNSGALTVNNGIVWLASDNSGTPNQLASVSSITLTSPGQLVYNGATSPATVTSTISGNGTLNVSTANGVTFNGNLSNYNQSIFLYSTNATAATTKATISASSAYPAFGVVYQAFARTTSLTQTFEYTGSGNVSFNNNNQYNPGANGQTFVFANTSTTGATITGSGFFQNIAAFSANAEFNVGASAGIVSLSAQLLQASTGVLNVSKTGTGTLTLSGANSFTGTVSVSAGTLNANSATALGAASSTTAISVTSGATLSLGGASNITYTAPRTLTLAGSGVGGTAGALVINNAVTNTFSGIALTAGTVIRGSESGTLTAPVTTNDHNLTLTVANTKTLTLSSTSVIGASTSTVATNTLSGDTGTLVLSAQNLYTGPTTVNRGTVRVGASSVGSPGSVTSGPLGRGQLTWNGGALDASTTATLGNNVVLGGDVSFSGTAALTLAGTVSLGASRTITTNGSSGVLTLSGVVSGTGFSLTKAGANTLVLSGPNTYSGGTTISGGTLSISADNNLGTAAGSIFIINQAATFKVTSTFTLDPNRAIRLGLTSGSSTGIIEVDSGQTLTISGFIDDNGAGIGILGKTGTGTLFLLANNAYAGGTNIVAGTVRTVAASSLGTGGVSLTSGGSLWVSRDSFFNITRLTVASLDNGQGCTIKIS